MSVSSSYSAPRLADHVRACRVGDQLIFLDLLQSRYIGMGGPQIAPLSDAIFGKVAADGLRAQPADIALLENCIHGLRQQNLLSDAPPSEPIRGGPLLDMPAASLAIDDEERPAHFEWRRLLRLWRSTFIAAAWLRRNSLADIAETLVALRARHPRLTGQTSADPMRAAVKSYLRLRPFALSAHDRCLHDSLTLIHLLATEGLFAQWVIGVRVNPFGAHSWAQTGDIVLNDYPERVRRFQPILVV